MELFSIRLKILYTFESGIAQLVERILVDGKGGGGGKGSIPSRTHTLTRGMILCTWIFRVLVLFAFSRFCLRENYLHAKIKPNGL